MPASYNAHFVTSDTQMGLKDVSISPTVLNDAYPSRSSIPHHYSDVHDHPTMIHPQRNSTDGYSSETQLRRLMRRLEHLEQKLETQVEPRLEDDFRLDDKTVYDGDNNHQVKYKDQHDDDTREQRPFSIEDEILHLATEDGHQYQGRWQIGSKDCNSILIVSDVPMKPNPVQHPLSNAHNDNRFHPEDDNTTAGELAEDEAAKNMPDRVAIGCPVLLREIERIANIDFRGANVLVRPFKVLVPFREEYEQRLREIEASLKDHDIANNLSLPPQSPEIFQTDVPYQDESKQGDYLAAPEDDYDRLLSNKKLKNGLKCLIHWMDTELQDILTIRAKIENGILRSIAFENLWQLFSPGDRIIAGSGSRKQAYRVLHVTGGRYCLPASQIRTSENATLLAEPQYRTDFLIDCLYVDFNGTHFGPAQAQFRFVP